MTHDEWEKGKKLTIHNATKEQLKFMVKDRDSTIRRLIKEIKEKNEMINGYEKVIFEIIEKNL